jgi:YHS domain-containing protein
MVKDPVCKMEIEEKDAKFKTEFEGKTYYFCNLSDKKKFEANPKKYLEL